MQQRWIGAKFFRPAVELAHIAQQDFSSSAKRTHHASNLNILLPILAQVANFFTVAIRAHHGKPALLIRRLRMC